MEIFLVLNDYEIHASVDEQQRIVLEVASGKMDRPTFLAWLRLHVVARS